MNLISIVLVALALSMDAFAVSISSGIALKKIKPGQALFMAAHVGFFQAFMPVMGWLAGRWAIDLIQAVCCHNSSARMRESQDSGVIRSQR